MFALSCLESVSQPACNCRDTTPCLENVLGMFLGSYILCGIGVNRVRFVVYLLVFGALLVAVTVSSAARAGSAAMPPPPFPGA